MGNFERNEEEKNIRGIFGKKKAKMGKFGSKIGNIGEKNLINFRGNPRILDFLGNFRWKFQNFGFLGQIFENF